MVRNTRLALACGLLTAATVALVGSGQLARPDTASLLPLPFAAGYALLRSEGWVESPRVATPPVTTTLPERADSESPSLEGNRRPRGPRAGRDATARAER